MQIPIKTDSQISRLQKWTYQRFKSRSNFTYPSFLKSISCCGFQNKKSAQKLKFAKRKLNKQLDFARFVNQQRETYMAYLSTMACFQQSVCQKLGQITYDESLSSQSSSAGEHEGNAEFMWNGIDESNISLLFLNQGDNISKRLVNLLQIQAQTEKMSKRRKRKRISKISLSRSGSGDGTADHNRGDSNVSLTTTKLGGRNRVLEREED